MSSAGQERATGRAEPREIAYASGRRRNGRGKSVCVCESERDRDRDGSKRTDRQTDGQTQSRPEASKSRVLYYVHPCTRRFIYIYAKPRPVLTLQHRAIVIITICINKTARYIDIGVCSVYYYS